MATQFHTTPFGLLVRFISDNGLFRYPDECDPSLWERFEQQESSSNPTPPDEKAKTSNLDSGEQQVSWKNHVGKEGDKEHQLVGWYGPDDPENPHNWPNAWKLLIAFQMCFLNFAVYIASSIYVPGETSVVEEFGVSETVATLGLSLFTIGYGLGPMLWSPMSEMPTLGRSGIYFWTLLAFILLQLPVGLANNMPMFLVFRLLTGFCGSPCLSTGGGTLADIYDGARVAYALCIWGSAGICGPVFGPIIGGYLAPAGGWRWTIWVFTCLCSLVLVMFFFLLPETSAANILYRRAKRLRMATGNSRLRSQSEIDTIHHTAKDRLKSLAKAFTLTFSEPIVFLMNLYTALVYGVLFIWFESFPIVFSGIYGFSLGQQGLAFLGIFIGAIITLPLFLVWIRYGIVPRFTKPNFKPEMVLPPTFFGAIALPACLFWYGWSAQPNVHWIMPIIGSGFFSIGVVTLFNSVLNYLVISYPAYAASIFAGNALFRATFGAVFPLFAPSLFTRLGIGPGNSLLGGIAVCFIPIPFVFYTYGRKIRHLSKNARHDV